MAIPTYSAARLMAEAQREAINNMYRQQLGMAGMGGLGLLGQQAAMGELRSGDGRPYNDSISFKESPKGVRAELQAETDEWLKDVNL